MPGAAPHLAESDAFAVGCWLGRRRPGLTHLFLFLFPTTAPYRREITCTFSHLLKLKKKKIQFACQELFVRFTELVVECWTFFKCPKDSGETEAAGAGACLELSLLPRLGEDQWWSSGQVLDRSCSHCKETWGDDREVTATCLFRWETPGENGAVWSPGRGAKFTSQLPRLVQQPGVTLFWYPLRALHVIPPLPHPLACVNYTNFF